MTKDEKEKVKKFAKKHWLSLGATGLVMILVNAWMANKMQHDPFTHYIVMTFLINTIIGVAYARIYRTLTKDRKNETAKKDS